MSQNQSNFRINRSLEHSNQQSLNFPKRYFSRQFRERHSSSHVQQNEFELTERSNSSRHTEIEYNKHRSTLKGRKQIATEFRFFRSVKALDFSAANRAAKEKKKQEINQIIEELDKKSKELTEESININQEQIED